MNKRARDFAEKWPYHWFGFWGNEQKVLGKPFNWDDHIDPTWLPSDRLALIHYLKTSPIALAAQQPPAKCPFCNELLYLSAYRSDSIWLWTDPLNHYVEKHFCVLPDRMVQQIRANDYKAPKSLTVDVKDLPWPESK